MIGTCFYDLVIYGCNDFDVVGILNSGRSIYIESCALMLRFCAEVLFALCVVTLLAFTL